MKKNTLLNIFGVVVLLAIAVLMVFKPSNKVIAAEGVWQITSPESIYAVSQTTVTIGSTTITTLLATNGYNKRTIYNVGASTVHARWDGYYDVRNRVQNGYPIPPGTAYSIESNNAVGLLTENVMGATVTVRVLQLQKN